MTELSPGLILIIGAVLVPILRGRARSIFMLALPILAFALTLSLPQGIHGQFNLFDMTLTTVRVDGFSLIFAYAFLLASLIAIIYALHVDDTLQQIASLIYAGSAISAVFAGDLLTLFVFWEGTTIGSVILIFAARTRRSYGAGMRYLVVQIVSGVLLLAGAALHYVETGSLAFGNVGIGTTAGVLIFIAFGIKCAFPLLHNWVEDSYPEATVTGAVFLSVFSTKLAVYALARGYPGTEILVPIGATMAVFPILFAVVENDLRRVLAYSLISQLGFMVVGVGIGTELSLNGAVAHAFCSVVYTALLFMAIGAVLFRAGTVNGSELGGLFRTMPWTAGLCIVGSAAIAAFPLTSGFVSKSMIVSGALKEYYFWAWLALLIGNIGVFHSTAIKVPYLAFFAKDSGKRPAEAPPNMLVAMAISAALCIGIGFLPSSLYSLLPFPVDYLPYTVEHVVTQLQLLMFSALALALLMRTGTYPPELPSINLDFDWFYRRLLYDTAQAATATFVRVRSNVLGMVNRQLSRFMAQLYRHHGPTGLLARTWPTGSMAFWATFLLGAYMLLYYF